MNISWKYFDLIIFSTYIKKNSFHFKNSCLIRLKIILTLLQRRNSPGSIYCIACNFSLRNLVVSRLFAPSTTARLFSTRLLSRSFGFRFKMRYEENLKSAPTQRLLKIRSFAFILSVSFWIATSALAKMHFVQNLFSLYFF